MNRHARLVFSAFVFVAVISLSWSAHAGFLSDAKFGESGYVVASAPPSGGAKDVELGAAAASIQKKEGAVQETNNGPVSEITQAGLRRRMQQINENKDIPEAVKKQILDIYQRAFDQIGIVDELRKRSAALEHDRANAPAVIERLREQLAQPMSEPATTDLAQMQLAELEKSAADIATKLEEAKGLAEKWEAEPKRRATRRQEIAKLQTTAKQQIVQLQKDLNAKPNEKDRPELQAAQRVLLRVQNLEIEARLDLYSKELRTFDTTSDLVTLRRDETKRQSSLLEKELKAWRAASAARRKSDAELAAQLARQKQESLQSSDSQPYLRDLAKDIAEISERRQALVTQIELVTKETEKHTKRLAEIREQFKSVSERIQRSGVVDATAMFLRQQLSKLPSDGYLTRLLKQRQQAISEVQNACLDFEQQRAELVDIDSQTQTILEAAAKKGFDDPAMGEEIKRTLTEKRDNLDALLNDYTKYFSLLIDLESTEKLLLVESTQFHNFVSDRTLWTRASSPIQWSDFAETGEGLARFASYKEWSEILNLLGKDFRTRPQTLAMTVGLLIGLFLIRGKLRTVLKNAAERASKKYTGEFMPTLRAMCATLLLSLSVPLPIWFLAWRLHVVSDAANLAKGFLIVSALSKAGIACLMLEMFRQLCRSGGLAEAHFGWPSRVVKLLRSTFVLLFLGLPMLFMVAVCESSDRDTYGDTLGRMMLMPLLLLLAVCIHRLLRLKNGVFAEQLAEKDGTWYRRLNQVWYTIGVATPIVFAGLAAYGYYETVVRLSIRLKITIWFSLALLMAFALFQRWLHVTRLKLALEQAKKRRSQAQLERKEGEPAIAADAEPEINLTDADNQSHRLLRGIAGMAYVVCLWLVWKDVVPAIGVLENITLWTTSAPVDTSPPVAPAVPGVGVPGTSTPAVEFRPNGDRTIAITLKDAIVAASLAFMTVVAARNIPGILEISVLQQLPIDAGGRFAIATVCKYLISLVGSIFTCSAIGLQWSSIQWLVAAMTVGLGFGLQEIVANFISGLILLLERPIRVGDTVTIGEVTGVVSKVRIRATTITDSDRKELIVPNKELITGKLLNWTLSDSTLRVTVKVGVAYGTNANQVESLLKQIANEHPLVLRDPAPSVSFERFGDSCLDFALRAYVGSISHAGRVQHDMHMAIDSRFRAAKLEIAFPQYDVHVRSMPNRITDADVKTLAEAMSQRLEKKSA